jgi:hypothetical protein
MSKTLSVGALMAAVVLCGCVVNAVNQRGQAWVGRDVGTWVAALGYPSSESHFRNDTVYTWDSSSSAIVPITGFSTVNANVGGTPVNGYATHTSFVRADRKCVVQVGTDAAGKILNFRAEGDARGCTHAAYALRDGQPHP